MPVKGKLHDRSDKIVDFICRFDGIGDLPVDDRVNIYHDVVAADDRLRREVDELFSKIEVRDARPSIRPVNRSRGIDHRDDDVKPAACDAVKSTESFDQEHTGLRHDFYGFERDRDHRDRKNQQKDGTCAE
jgi:hypothetical protein